MNKKVGRPGNDRAKLGRITGTILPELKMEFEAIAKHDKRWRSMSHAIESAVGFFLHHYKASNGQLDGNNFPIVGRGDPFSQVEHKPRGGHAKAHHP